MGVSSILLGMEIKMHHTRVRIELSELESYALFFFYWYVNSHEVPSQKLGKCIPLSSFSNVLYGQEKISTPKKIAKKTKKLDECLTAWQKENLHLGIKKKS